MQPRVCNYGHSLEAKQVTGGAFGLAHRRASPLWQRHRASFGRWRPAPSNLELLAACAPLAWLQLRRCVAQRRATLRPLELRAAATLTRRPCWSDGAVDQLDQAVEEAIAARASARDLASRLADLRSEAEATARSTVRKATWLPEGCENAPPHIMQKLMEMTSGAGSHPANPVVDVMWIAMAKEAEARRGRENLKRSHAWAMPSTLLEAQDSGAAESCQDAQVAEALARRRALRAALEEGVPRAAPATSHGPELEVYATHLTNDDYILGAEVLAASLAATGTTRPLLALVTAGVSAAGRQSLERAGWLLLDVELAGVAGEDTPQARGFFSKIWLWALPCHSVIYIDTDVLVLDNLDALFQLSRESALQAAPDSQPHMDGQLVVQTGFLVVRPSLELFTDLWEIICGSRRIKHLDKWSQFEQGFFTLYFEDDPALEEAGGGCGLGWQQLPAKYNFCARYDLRPLYKGLTPATAAMVHFACAKPWDPMQRNYAAPWYCQLYLAFARAAGIRWSTVVCSADRAREEENIAKMQKIMREREARGER